MILRLETLWPQIWQILVTISSAFAKYGLSAVGCSFLHLLMRSTVLTVSFVSDAMLTSIWSACPQLLRAVCSGVPP